MGSRIRSAYFFSLGRVFGGNVEEEEEEEEAGTDKETVPPAVIFYCRTCFKDEDIFVHRSPKRHPFLFFYIYIYIQFSNCHVAISSFRFCL